MNLHVLVGKLSDEDDQEELWNSSCLLLSPAVKDVYLTTQADFTLYPGFYFPRFI